jgi:hypothetical protein
VLEGKAKKPKWMFAVMRNRIMEESKEIAMHTPLKIEQVVELSEELYFYYPVQNWYSH